MRTLLVLFSIAYGGAAVDDTQFIKPSQPLSLQIVLDSNVPEWIGTAARVSFGD